MTWLKNQLSQAMDVSLELVNDLYNFWGKQSSILRSEDRDSLRSFVLELSKERLSDSEKLYRILHPKNPYSICNLVFSPAAHEYYTDIEPWIWLGPVLLDLLKKKRTIIAAEVGYLVKENSDNSTINVDVFKKLFSKDGLLAAKLIKELSVKVDPDHSKRISSIADAALLVAQNS